MSSHRSAARRRHTVLALAVCAASLPLASKAHAASPYTWTQTAAGTYNWSTAGNWDANGVPTSSTSSVVNFFPDFTTTGPAAGSVLEADNDIGSPLIMNVLNLSGTTTGSGAGFIFNIGPTAGGGNGLQLDGTNAQINFNASYGGSTDGGTTYNINTDIRFNTDTTLTFANNGGNLNINQSFHGAGNLTVTNNESNRYVNIDAAGAGVIAASDYSGNVNVTAGVLRLGNVHNIFGTNGVTSLDSGAGLGAQTITVSNNASLVLDELSGAFSETQNYVLSGNGTNATAPNGNGTGAGQQLGVDAAMDVNNYQFSQVFIGGVAIAANATIRTDILDVAGNAASRPNFGLQLDGPLSGSGSLTKIGTGSIWLNAASGAFTGTGGYGAFTGNVTVNGGMIVNTNVVGALGLNGMTFVAGTGYSGTPGSQTVTVNPGGAYVLMDGNFGAGATTQNFVISGSGETSRAAVVDAAGVDAALQVLTVNAGNHIVYGGLALAGNATIRINSTGRFTSDDQNNNQVHDAANAGLQFNGPLAGSGTLTKIGTSELGTAHLNGAVFDEYQLPYAYGIQDVTDGILEFNATAGIVGSYSAFTGNVSVQGGVLATGHADNALGFNTAGTQIVTISNTSKDNFGDTGGSGSSMLLDESNGGFKNPQNFILNGTGTSDPLPTNATGLADRVAGSDAALEAYRINFGNATVGGIDIQTASTIRVNTDMGGTQLALGASSSAAATVASTTASTLSAPNLALEVDGPLVGAGTLTLIGKTGDKIEEGLFVSTGGYGTLYLTKTSSSTLATTGMPDTVFTGNVNVNGGVLELGAASNILGPNTSTSQTVTVASGAAVVFSAGNGAYNNPQNFVINGTGTGDATVGALGATASLEATGINFANSEIRNLTLATASTIKVTSTAPFGLQVDGALAGSGAMSLTGAGSLILKVASSYGQNITVNGATLVASNTTGSATGTANITLNGGAFASGVTGSITGNVLAGSAAHTIAPGGVGAIGSLSIGGLTTSNLSTLNFDLGTGAGPIITNGDLLTLGAGTVSIPSGTLLSFGGTPVGGMDYRLIGGSISGITLTNFTLPTAPSGLGYSLSKAVDSGFIDLVVTGSSGPANLVWSGGTAAWDVAGSSNWNAGAAKFNQGDNVTFDDTVGAGSLTVTANTTVQPTSVAVNGTKSYIFNGTGGIANVASGVTALTQHGTGSLTISTNNTYTGATTIGTGSDSPTLTLTSAGKIASTSVVVNAGAIANINGVLTGTPAVTVAGTATLGVNDGVNGTAGAILVRSLGTLNVSGTLNVAATTTVNHAQRTVLVTTGLTNTGKIDLSNNDLIVKGTSASTLFSQLKNGFAAHVGYWNGTTGITSSSAAGDTRFLTTLGYRQSAGGTVDTVSTTTADALVKYTYYGDANLDGVVNGADYQQIDLGFGSGGTDWSHGDFNYDGVVNGSDFALIDNTFNQITASGATSLAVIASPANLIASPLGVVPEPAMLGLLGVGAIGLMGRRRRRVV